jgi:predicted nucleic acid-binding protein
LAGGDLEPSTPSHVVVDTDVFIWLSRGKAQATRYAPYVVGQRVVLSFATVAELWRGAYTRGYSQASRSKLEVEIGTTVVVNPTSALTHEWAQLVREMRLAGHALGQPAQAHDAWVAATARHFQLPLLTENRRHLEGVPGVQLIDLPTA